MAPLREALRGAVRVVQRAAGDVAEEAEAEVARRRRLPARWRELRMVIPISAAFGTFLSLRQPALNRLRLGVAVEAAGVAAARREVAGAPLALRRLRLRVARLPALVDPALVDPALVDRVAVQFLAVVLRRQQPVAAVADAATSSSILRTA